MKVHVSCLVFFRLYGFSFKYSAQTCIFFTCCCDVNELAINLVNTNMLLDLPSSASAVDFADNTNNNFKVRLPQKLVLEPGEWEVGALVAHIPNKFYNMVAGDVTSQSPKG